MINLSNRILWSAHTSFIPREGEPLRPNTTSDSFFRQGSYDNSYKRNKKKQKMKNYEKECNTKSFNENKKQL